MASVKYSKRGNWLPTIPNQICAHCQCDYTAHKYTQKFCSRSCASKYRAYQNSLITHTKRICPGCGNTWSANKSNKSKYCSKKCLYDSGKWQRRTERECETCGANFKKSPDCVGKYCSKNCYTIGQAKNKIKKSCVNCGKDFKVSKSRNDAVTCSDECSSAYHIRDRHHCWNGGEILQGNRFYRRFDRDGYQAKYEGEHRLIASRIIGRNMNRGEAVICIDRNNNNLKPDNLFIIPNTTELALLRAGSIEWPTKSNLEDYKNKGYTRPPVRIVLHEWNNGTRVASGMGKPISRHPQADEIIKRRKAGATLKQLSDAFDTCQSNMGNILKNRL